MSSSDSIVCKPTSWFLLRALAMLLMSGSLAFYFYFDATTGYPRKNAVYYLHKTFQDAGDRFLKSDLLSDEWRAYAARQTVALPDDPSILPPEVQPGMKWPEILQDASQLRNQTWNKSTMQDAWAEMSKFSLGLPDAVPLGDGEALVVFYNGPHQDQTDVVWQRVG